MKKVLFAAALALGGLAGASGVAHATDFVGTDDFGVPWSWPTQGACMADGPDMHLDNVHEDAVYKFWYCEQGDDGLWYLYNTDTP